MSELKFSQIKLVLFDLDGTIYNGNQLIPNADLVVQYFREQNKIIRFGTNNSTKSRSSIATKLNTLGVTCTPDEIVTSSFLAAEYVKRTELNHCFVFGEDGLIFDLTEHGIDICGEENAENLVIGFSKNLDYDYLSQAFRVAKKAKRIIACNLDRSYPAGDGKVYPGCGLIVSGIEWCANRKSDIVVGKPSTYMLRYLQQTEHVSASEMLCIGDGEETDAGMAISFGSPCYLIGSQRVQNGVACINHIAEIMDLDS